MSSIKSVCVYCGSSSAVDDLYKNAAKELGVKMARNNMRLVYGGGASGLMGTVADAVLAGGGKVTGIFPEFLREFESPHKHLTEIHVVNSMHERKQMMAERSDCFVVLPGGFGTLDEFFEILTWRQLQLHNKPVFLVNIDGYWSPLLKMLAQIFDKKFARDIHRNCFTVSDSIDGLIHSLKMAGSGENLDSAHI